LFVLQLHRAASTTGTTGTTDCVKLVSLTSLHTLPESMVYVLTPLHYSVTHPPAHHTQIRFKKYTQVVHITHKLDIKTHLFCSLIVPDSVRLYSAF
jgi:hypothetical protein